MDFYNYFIQGIGVLGMLASILSSQCKKHGNILIFRTLNEMLFGVQYLLLGAYTGAAMNFAGSVRNVVFRRMVAKNKSTRRLCVGFGALFLLFTALTWGGVKSVFSGVAKVVSTFAYGNPNPKLVRLGVLFSCTGWLIYNVWVKSYAGIASEAFTLVSVLIAIVRLDLPRRSEANAEDPASDS